jgi:hypothetical protein
MAKGTAVLALEASSEIWTQESKPPILQTGESQAIHQIRGSRGDIPMMKANPLTQPEVFSQPPKMKSAELRSSLGVVAGKAAKVAMIIAKFAKTNTF